MDPNDWRTIATFERELMPPSEEDGLDWDAAMEAGTTEQAWRKAQVT